jgi:hypothetical protein
MTPLLIDQIQHSSRILKDCVYAEMVTFLAIAVIWQHFVSEMAAEQLSLSLPQIPMRMSSCFQQWLKGPSSAIVSRIGVYQKLFFFATF